jgi:hypothetical protein
MGGHCVPADNVRINVLLQRATPLEHCCGRSWGTAVLDMVYASAQQPTASS